MQHLSSPKHPRLAAGLLLLLLLLLAGTTAWAQAPAWQMAVATTQANGTEAHVTVSAANSAGEVYVAGYFSGTMTLGGTTLASVGSHDIFIAKWSRTTGSFRWAQRAGGTGDDRATGLATSGATVYMTGTFSSPTADFGPVTLTNAGAQDAFVAKLSDAGGNGSYVWTQQIGGMGDDTAEAVALSGPNLYVAGSFSNQVNFGATPLTSAGLTDVFVAKLTDTGNSASFLWSLRAGGGSYDNATAVAVNGTNVYVAGDFYISAYFGTINLNGAGNADVFVAKLSDAGGTGSFVWAQQAGGNQDDHSQALAVSGPNVYVSGRFRSTPARFGGIFLNTFGNYDVFVTKLTDTGSAGSFGWTQQAGGQANDHGNTIAVSGTSIYIAGAFNIAGGSSTASFGSITLDAANGTLFVAKISDVGTNSAITWVQQAGGPGTGEADGMAINGTSVYIGGTVLPPSWFGSFATPAMGGPAAFLASLTDPTLTATTAARSDFSFALAPNPAHAATSLTLPAVPGAATATLTLLDALGRAVRTRPATPGTRTDFDLSGLAPGLYALRATAGAATATQRLVVE